MSNFVAILKSSRFQMIALGWLLFWISGGDVLTALEGLAATTAGVGTLDKFGKSLGGN